MSTNHIIAINRPGDPGWIKPGSEQHTAMISPSKVSAMLGFSRWQSPYGLWMEMAGRVEPDPPKDIYAAGHQFEATAAEMWRDDNPGWRLSPGEVQFVMDPEHFGFPAMATLDRRAVRGRARRVVEFKIARDLGDLERFGDDLTGDAPPDYSTQVFTQMLFTGFTKIPGHLLVIGPFYDHRVYQIDYNTSVAAGLITTIKNFWESLQSDTPPELDNHTATYQTVRKLHPNIDHGTNIVLDADLAIDFLDAYEAEAEAKKRLTGAKTRVLDAMGDTEAALVGETAIAKRSPHASGSVALNKARKTTAQDIRFQNGAPA